MRFTSAHFVKSAASMLFLGAIVAGVTLFHHQAARISKLEATLARLDQKQNALSASFSSAFVPLGEAGSPAIGARFSELGEGRYLIFVENHSDETKDFSVKTSRPGSSANSIFSISVAPNTTQAIGPSDIKRWAVRPGDVLELFWRNKLIKTFVLPEGDPSF